MHVLVTYLITAALLLVTFVSIGDDILATFAGITEAWPVIRKRSDQRVNTKIERPTNLSVSAAPSVQITLFNTGTAAVGPFRDWDVLFEVQKSPGLAIATLTYTENASPGANQWTVQSIYLDDSASPPKNEIVDIGTLNAGEKMVVLANPSPTVTANTHDRATFVTPNGVTAKVIFEVVS